MKNILLVGIFALLVVANAKHLPKYVKTCKTSDPDKDDCFKQAILDLMPKLLEGIPEMGVPILDPLLIPQMLIDSGKGGSFELELDITNATMYGLDAITIVKAQMDREKDTLSFILKYPVVKTIGKYRAKGKILIIPINGGGDLEFNFEKCTLDGVLQGTKYIRKGKEHYKFEVKSFTIGIEGGSGEFGTLFENSKELTENTNKVFNENFDIAVDEFKPAIQKVLQTVMINVVNNVHERYPIEELYP